MKMYRLLLLLICFSVTVSAQGKKETYPVNINNTHFTERVEIFSDEVKVKPEEDLTYHWYAYNKVMKTDGGYEGKLLHGEYAAFYLNNNLKEKGKFRKGLKHGKWISWYDNGKIMEITSWDNGKKDGPYRSYNTIGEPVLIANFRDGKLHGKSTSYLDGKILSEKKYRNGEEVIPKVKTPRGKKAKKETTATPANPGDNEKTKGEGKNSFLKKIRNIKIFPKKVKKQENTTPDQKTLKEKKRENKKAKNDPGEKNQKD